MSYFTKEWIEQTRGKGLWISFSVTALVSLLLLLQSRSLPADQGMEVYLLSLYEMNVYLLPLFSLFMSSMAVFQEKEQKTLLILLTKRESYTGYLLKKSAAVQSISLLLYAAWFFVLALPLKMMFAFNPASYLSFLITLLTLVLLFNQIGVCVGSVTSSRMQLAGANIFVWFVFLFLMDLVMLYMLPSVTHETVRAFSVLYFLDPLHTLRIFLESSLGMFPMEHMSRLMQSLVWLPPQVFLLADLAVWLAVPLAVAASFGYRGNQG